MAMLLYPHDDGETSAPAFNFTGNFVWVRVYVTYTQGQINPDIIKSLRLKMEHFVRIVMEKQDELVEGLDKSYFPESNVLERARCYSILFH